MKQLMLALVLLICVSKAVARSWAEQR